MRTKVNRALTCLLVVAMILGSIHLVAADDQGYDAPEKEYAPYVERVLQADLHHVAENIVAETVQNAAAAFAATMGAAADEN